MEGGLQLVLRETVHTRKVDKIIPPIQRFNALSFRLIKVYRRGLCSEQGEEAKMIRM